MIDSISISEVSITKVASMKSWVIGDNSAVSIAHKMNSVSISLGLGSTLANVVTIAKVCVWSISKLASGGEVSSSCGLVGGVIRDHSTIRIGDETTSNSPRLRGSLYAEDSGQQNNTCLINMQFHTEEKYK